MVYKYGSSTKVGKRIRKKGSPLKNAKAIKPKVAKSKRKSKPTPVRKPKQGLSASMRKVVRKALKKK